MKKTFIAISLALFSCLTLAACTANATSTQEIPSNSGEDQAAPMNTSTQVCRITIHIGQVKKKDEG